MVLTSRYHGCCRCGCCCNQPLCRPWIRLLYSHRCISRGLCTGILTSSGNNGGSSDGQRWSSLRIGQVGKVWRDGV